MDRRDAESFPHPAVPMIIVGPYGSKQHKRHHQRTGGSNSHDGSFILPSLFELPTRTCSAARKDTTIHERRSVLFRHYCSQLADKECIVLMVATVE